VEGGFDGRALGGERRGDGGVPELHHDASESGGKRACERPCECVRERLRGTRGDERGRVRGD
jgi:hypothetical protein